MVIAADRTKLWSELYFVLFISDSLQDETYLRTSPRELQMMMN